MGSASIPVRVLVVDDDEMSRELLCALLEAEGYAVDSADCGEAALTHLCNSAAPDLVLADAQMPGIAGPQLADRLRRACPSATLVLAMSASRPREQAIACFDGFLLKPFKMAEVAAALSTRTPPADATEPAVKRERWTVVAGPAARSSSRSQLISISASAAAPVAPKSAKKKQPPAKSPIPDSANAAPVLNETIHRKLADSVSAPQLQEMYAMCIDDVRRRIATMRQLAATRNGEQFVREAHAIKGGCGMLGATELHQLAALLEVHGLDADNSRTEKKVNSLDELSAACDRLERMLGSRV